LPITFGLHLETLFAKSVDLHLSSPFYSGVVSRVSSPDALSLLCYDLSTESRMRDMRFRMILLLWTCNPPGEILPYYFFPFNNKQLDRSGILKWALVICMLSNLLHNFPTPAGFRFLRPRSFPNGKALQPDLMTIVCLLGHS
jgi:hypothetical protein